jgi:peptide/nickel transport system substrate-binding protein
MYNTTMPQPDPQIFMNQYTSWQVANKENKWQGRNITRWQSKEYDALYKQAEQELDAVKRAAMYIKLNDMVVGDNYIQPIASRARTTALKAGLTAHLSGWDNDLWQLASWYREA